MMVQRRHIAILLLFAVWTEACAAQSFGSFVGRVVAEWLDDGRKMKLVEAFSYIDPAGSRWDAPQGWIVDGASIPQFAWSIIGGPFEGPYRNASVIHDVACDVQNRPWRDVHRAFYTAMLAANVEPMKAKIMYGAVYQFGPRWEHQVKMTGVPLQSVEPAIAHLRSATAPGERLETQVSLIPRRGCPTGLNCSSPIELPPNAANIIATFRPESPRVTANPTQEFERLQAFIEATNPSLEAIEQFR